MSLKCVKVLELNSVGVIFHVTKTRGFLFWKLNVNITCSCFNQALTLAGFKYMPLSITSTACCIVLVHTELEPIILQSELSDSDDSFVS